MSPREWGVPTERVRVQAHSGMLFVRCTRSAQAVASKLGVLQWWAERQWGTDGRQVGPVAITSYSALPDGNGCAIVLLVPVLCGAPPVSKDQIQIGRVFEIPLGGPVRLRPGDPVIRILTPS